MILPFPLAGSPLLDLLRNLLRNPLMRSRSIEISNIFFDDPIQLCVAENQQMIQAFAAHSAHEAFAHRIRGGARSGIFTISIPLASAI